MTWSYSNDPASSDLDQVRFLLQDTDSGDQLLADEEIQFLIDNWAERGGSLYYVAALCAETLAAKFAREVSVSADGVSVAVEQLQTKYNDLALSLRDQHKAYLGTGPNGPLANGSIFDVEADPAIRPLSFGKGMHDNLRGGQQDFGGVWVDPAREAYTSIPEDAL